VTSGCWGILELIRSSIVLVSSCLNFTDLGYVVCFISDRRTLIHFVKSVINGTPSFFDSA
jgi:hypothetical protein